MDGAPRGRNVRRNRRGGAKNAQVGSQQNQVGAFAGQPIQAQQQQRAYSRQHQPMIQPPMQQQQPPAQQQQSLQLNWQQQQLLQQQMKQMQMQHQMQLQQLQEQMHHLQQHQPMQQQQQQQQPMQQQQIPQPRFLGQQPQQQLQQHLPFHQLQPNIGFPVYQQQQQEEQERQPRQRQQQQQPAAMQVQAQDIAGNATEKPQSVATTVAVAATEGGGKKKKRSRKKRDRKRKESNQQEGIGQPQQQQPQQQQQQQVLASLSSEASGAKKREFFTNTKFKDLKISPLSKRALAEVLKYEWLTKVQEAAIPAVASGKDVLARAKTGTGKTLGFLIPAVESLCRIKAGGGRLQGVSILCISPTRELASQIALEASKLVTFHRMSVLSCVGGTNVNTDKRKLAGQVDVLVATPGRLLDHLKNHGLSSKLQHLRVLVLDEADQLLEMGFQPDLLRIFSFLPPPAAPGAPLGMGRQTLLFSATMPPALHKVAHLAMRSGDARVTINTISKEEDSTHSQVAQTVVTVPLHESLCACFELLVQHQRSVKDYKAIVFLPTARATGFMAELFRSLPGQSKSTLEIHSRKPQGFRTRTAEKFKKECNLVLFSSDVSARGVDYPDVTLILQVGITQREQYIHRLGRTARAGKVGEGILLLCPFEERAVLPQLKGLPVKRRQHIVEGGGAYSCQAVVEAAIGSVARDASKRKGAEQAYQAWLGFYNSNLRKIGWNQRQLVAAAEDYARLLGLPEAPKLLKRTIGKMGLKGVLQGI